jgi:hypothetical protein
MRMHRKRLRCPLCHCNLLISRLMFLGGLPCPQCGSILRVSTAYQRGVNLFSAVVGFLLVWIGGVRNSVLFSMLWVPTALVILAVVLRIAPIVVPPVLVVGRPSNLTTLGLGSGRDKS